MVLKHYVQKLPSFVQKSQGISGVNLESIMKKVCKLGPCKVCNRTESTIMNIRSYVTTEQHICVQSH
jgi:hypothetical protein